LALPTTHDHIGRVVVPVTINGRGPFRFIVDTGANHSTITPGLVHTLGLKADGQTSILLQGITGSTAVSYVSVDRLEAGDFTVEDTTLPIVWAPVMAGADGILGAAGLSDKSLLIDFRRNRVAIASRVDMTARTDTTKIHAARVASGLLVLEGRVNGIPVEAVLDTGSERTLGNVALQEALKKTHGHSERGFVAQVTSVYGATTEVERGEIQFAPAITVDTLRLLDVAVVFGDFHIFKVWDMQSRPALILGMDVLGTVNSLSIDYRHRDVYVGTTRSSGEDLMQQLRGVLSDQGMKR
jgi:predicted aspartyl protease